MLIQPTSVSQTIDAVNAELFAQRKLPTRERETVGKWLATRQGLPGAYAGTFAGFDTEKTKGIVVFTGERITSASARHILGEETCRTLRLLDVRDRTAQAALARADEALANRLWQAERDPSSDKPGTYCCGKCTVGLWRNLSAGGLDHQEERLRQGVKYLRSRRDGEGEWRAFPYWFTVLALSEMDFKEAKSELAYARSTLEQTVARAPRRTTYAERRHELARRTLAGR